MNSEIEEYYNLHAPYDAAEKRARFERAERFNAFQDGALSWIDSPEGTKAISAAREAALARIRLRKNKSTA